VRSLWAVCDYSNSSSRASADLMFVDITVPETFADYPLDAERTLDNARRGTRLLRRRRHAGRPLTLGITRLKVASLCRSVASASAGYRSGRGPTRYGRLSLPQHYQLRMTSSFSFPVAQSISPLPSPCVIVSCLSARPCIWKVNPPPSAYGSLP
jgi:hypothetical protein